jgi:hypothetical protein
MSAPAEKLSPAPETSSTFTSGSASSSLNKPGSASHIARVSAFRLVSRSITRRATGPDSTVKPPFSWESMTRSQADATLRRRCQDHTALSVRDVRNSLKTAASCVTPGDVCLTPPVDNVLISADWVISSG